MAPFITSRCYEQIKCSIAAMDQNVNLVGIGVGLGYADAGPTHYTTEDIATMRVFPNIELLTPVDAISTKVIAEYSVKNNGFRFIRLDRDALPDVYKETIRLTDDGFFEVIKSDKTCIISNGFLLNKLQYNSFNKVDVGLIDLFKIKL